MNRSEKIMGMLTLLELNDDQFCYEMTSLAAKINNFLDDRSRLFSGQWLSVLYTSLTEETEENENEVVNRNAIRPVKINLRETFGTDINEAVKRDVSTVLEKAVPGSVDRRFALV